MARDFLQFFACRDLTISLDEVNGFYSLLLLCVTGIDFAQTFSEILTFVSDKDLIFEIRPVEFGLRFVINGNNDPLEDFVGFGLSVFDLYFGKSIGIDFGSDLDSFFPLGKIFFFVVFDLFAILIFLVTIFKFTFIDLDLSVELFGFLL